MRSTFLGYFRPTEDQFSQLWDSCIFSVDANVLLNLYRYSPETRSELEKAISFVKGKVFIPHQAAKEFLKNRLSVTSGQANEYNKAIGAIDDLKKMLSTKDRHPFLPESDLPRFTEFSDQLVASLKAKQKELSDKFTNDEILDFIESVFDGKTGQEFTDENLQEIIKEGEDRYDKEIPPGYKDLKKDQTNDPNRKYGDLIVWKQLITNSNNQSKPLIFITDDKKEDWWLQQSGRTVGPRPELIEEFKKETGQQFWMYTVDRFIQEVAKQSQRTVSRDVIDEIQSFDIQSLYDMVQEISLDLEKPSITVSQEVEEINDNNQKGLLVVTLNTSMIYATGTGKFNPRFSDVPSLEIKLVSSPYDNDSEFKLSYGCGTVKNFNVHLRGKSEELLSGDYVFKYTAFIEN